MPQVYFADYLSKAALSNSNHIIGTDD